MFDQKNLTGGFQYLHLISLTLLTKQLI